MAKTMDVAELAAILDGHAVVRARLVLVAVDESGWRLHHGEITLNNVEPVVERAWRYATATFLELPLPGAVAANLLRRERQEVFGLQVEFPGQPTASSASVQRLRGRQDWARLSTPWPRTEWTVNQDVNLPTPAQEVLVGEGPTYLNFDAALCAFLYESPQDSRLVRPDLWRIIQPDRDAWFPNITIGADRLTATVAGEHLDGVILELTEPTRHQRQPLNGAGTYTFDLPQGLGHDSLLVLRRDGQWLDLRYFPAPVYGRERDASVVWEDPGPELDILLAGGEGPHLELKREIPEGESRKKMLKTISAFASKDGGTVLIGIEDDLHIVGLGRQVSDDQAKLAITQMIRNCIEPDPSYTLRVINHNGLRVLAIEVSAGGQPHAYRNGERLEFFVRRGSNTVPARHYEIAAGFRHK
ncbi:ATP-binding protein [Streptomyces sp. NTH33]|uniref:AlbA family DNA-binding domain-containing protein n=1 Tax=Streptomyces sp. NTH33 TaxID=1735453 RepID=UPI000DA91DE7|nr:ATP-binding protein [Streptomyces sp. NTH33]PZH16442.1 ATP-binding protein [Streptomyces sp. NTH33]